MSDISDNLEKIHAQIAKAAASAGRKAEEIQLVAVSKTHPVEKIREAVDAGQVLFGESRVQEALVKIPLLPSQLRWHFIGHLQKNKIRKALPHFELIHGVESLETAEDISRIADEMGRFPKILLEVNVSGEGTKFGFRPEMVESQMETLLALPRIEIHGLMTMAPYSDDAEKARPHFRRLRELREKLQSDFRMVLPELSMGMSGDFEVGIQEGATLVRVGTAIFGSR